MAGMWYGSSLARHQRFKFLGAIYFDSLTRSKKPESLIFNSRADPKFTRRGCSSIYNGGKH
jgi:hypothetical protein